jgi:hypothetical protein
MTFIARTDGATSGAPLEVRVGALTDISEGARSNWRAVVQQQPAVGDGAVRTVPLFLIQPDGSVVMTWDHTAIPEMYHKMQLRQHAAEVRWRRSEMGITFGGNLIHTSDISQAKIHAAITVLDKGWLSQVNWKTADGWVQVDAATMGMIGQAVAQYVQACYDAEQALVSAINAGDVMTRAGIESWAGWPSNSF